MTVGVKFRNINSLDEELPESSMKYLDAPQKIYSLIFHLISELISFI